MDVFFFTTDTNDIISQILSHSPILVQRSHFGRLRMFKKHSNLF